MSEPTGPSASVSRAAASPVTLVAPFDTGQPTGILTYVQELVRRAPSDLDVRVRHLAKREWVVGGRRVGGTLSTWASLARTRFAASDGLVHAMDTFCLAKGSHVLTIHDLIPATVSRHAGARVHARMMQRRLHAVRRIITPTRVVADQVAAAYGIPQERLTVIPQGFDATRFRPVATVPDAIAAGRPNLLYVGAYRPYKRIDAVLQALAGTDIRFIRVGPPGTDAYAQRCRLLARQGEVDFQDIGYVPGTELAAYYSACDLLVYPSRDEGFGIPPLEAMACGTASLLSDIPVFREIYADAAHYVTAFDSSQLRQAIEDALRHPIPGNRLREQASHYSWDRTAAATYDVHRQVLQGLG